MKPPACSRLWQAEAIDDGRLGGSELASFERHARSCRTCSREVERLRELRELSSGLPELEASSLERRRQRQRLLWQANQMTVEPPRRVSRRALGAAVVLAATTAMAAGGAYMLRSPAPLARVSVAHRPVARAGHAAPATLAAVSSAPSPAPSAAPAASPAPSGSSTRPSARTVAGGAAHPAQNAPRTRHASGRAPALQHKVAARARGAPSAEAPDPPTAGQDFAVAMSAFNSGDFGRAERLFTAFAARHPRDSRAEDASFLRAVARQRRGDTEGAKALARQYLDRYPGALRQEEAKAMLGR